jgi:hypothetical protein
MAFSGERRVTGQLVKRSGGGAAPPSSTGPSSQPRVGEESAAVTRNVPPVLDTRRNRPCSKRRNVPRLDASSPPGRSGLVMTRSPGPAPGNAMLV